MQQSNCYHFGGFTLDLTRGCLRRGAEEIKLRPKSFEFLRYLAQHPGRLVVKAELIQALWPGTSIVTDDSLAHCAMDIRKALLDDGQQFVRTVPGRGYLFAANLRTELATSTGEVAAEPRLSWMRSRAGVTTLTAVTIALCAAGIAKVRQHRDPSAVTSIAVLPFSDGSEDPKLQYVSSGLTEGVILGLARTPALRVRSYSAVAGLKAEQRDVQELGKRFSVQAVIRGRVTQHGELISIAAEMIRVQDNTLLWSRNYERRSVDLAAIQGEIADDISRSLRRRPATTPHYTNQAEAYREYLKGRYAYNKRTPSGQQLALEHFQRATVLDPQFALAYVGLADCYQVMKYSRAAPRENLAKASEAAKRALSIDPTLAEAHAVLAHVIWRSDWDWANAVTEFKKAIELNPRYATAHHYYSNCLLTMGRVGEALDQARQALDLEPVQPILNSWLANVLFFERKHDDAAAVARSTLELEPGFGFAQLVLGRAYTQKAMYPEAVAALQSAVKSLQGNWVALQDLAYTYALSGNPVAARKIVNEMSAQAAAGYIPSVALATAYAGLGDKDHAIASLRQAVDERSPELWIRSDPRFDSLKSDIRFADVLARMKLKP